MPAIKSYLGKDVGFDHISIIVSPGSPSSAPQKLHADVVHAFRHLEVHIPLADVTMDMGPTRFCPASHDFLKKAGPSYALEQWFFAQARCEKSPHLAYARF